MDEHVRTQVHRWISGVHKKLLSQFRNLPAAYIGSQTLQNINVAVLPLDWQAENTIDLEPRFCAPWPTDSFHDILRWQRSSSEAGAYNWDEFRTKAVDNQTRLEDALELDLNLNLLIGSQIWDFSFRTRGEWMPLCVALYPLHSSVEADGYLYPTV